MARKAPPPAKTRRTKAAKESPERKPPRQTEIVGARPKRDSEIDDEAEVLEAKRAKRMKFGKEEQESEGKIVALAVGKGLVKEGETFDYVLPSGRHLIIGPKSVKMGAKIVDPPEEQAAEKRQVSLIEG